MRTTATSRSWFRYSLRTLALAILAIGIALGWYVSRARQQRALYQAIYHSNSSAYYDYELDEEDEEQYLPERKSWAPRWLHEQLGTDLLHPIVKVHFLDDIQKGRPDPRQVDDFCRRLTAFPRLRSVCLEYGTDERLRHIGQMRSLERVEIMMGGSVTDRGIEALSGLSQLRVLEARGVTPSKDSWSVLGRLRRLEILAVSGEELTDDALAELALLTQLRELRSKSNSSRVTDAGLKSLANLQQLEVLELSGHGVTDEGFAHLPRLPRLRVLSLELHRSQVTDRGVAQLAALKQLTDVHLWGIMATEEGLLPLAELRGLATVHIRGPNLNNGAELRKALPGCKVDVSSMSGGVAY
jgi:hypothetical protein